MNFYHWLIQNKNLSKATALKYDLVIKNRINEWLPSYELPQNSIEFEAFRFMEVVWKRDPVPPARLSKLAADAIIKKYAK